MILDSERCGSNLNCSVNVCPLYEKLHELNHLEEDGYCRHILDYLEGLPCEFEKEVRATEPIWTEIIGKGNLERRVEKRKVSRIYWEGRKEDTPVVIPSED